MRKEHITILAAAMIMVFIAVVLVISGAVGAGDLDPPAGPDERGSAMYTIEDIYNYLDTGVPGTKRGDGFMESDSPPPVSGQTPSPTLDDVHDKIWERCITCEGTLSTLGRWCDTGDGTVKDMTTGLVWLKDAGWGGAFKWADPGPTSQYWQDANWRVGYLQDGRSGSGLSDSSVRGMWRLPTKSELAGMTQGTEAVRSWDMHFFTNVQPGKYWSGSNYEGNRFHAWNISMSDGSFSYGNKDLYLHYVWPVRSDN